MCALPLPSLKAVFGVGQMSRPRALGLEATLGASFGLLGGGVFGSPAAGFAPDLDATDAAIFSVFAAALFGMDELGPAAEDLSLAVGLAAGLEFSAAGGGSCVDAGSALIFRGSGDATVWEPAKERGGLDEGPEGLNDDCFLGTGARLCLSCLRVLGEVDVRDTSDAFALKS